MAEIVTLKCRKLSNKEHSYEIDNPTSSLSPLLNDYVNRFHKISDKYVNLFPVDFSFRLVYHGFEDLFRIDKYKFYQELHKFDSNNKFPTVHLTPFDVLGAVETQYSEKEENLLELVRRYKNIMDSGIWNYYVPIFPRTSKASPNELDFTRFNWALQQIDQNTQRGLYNLAITHEYADLNARLLEQSYLEGSHKSVSPFLFHSEQEMKRKIKDAENVKDHDIPLMTLHKYRWRFLLLDDKGIEKMNGAKGNPVEITKLQIIASNLVRLGFDEDKIWFRIIDFKPIRDANGQKVLCKDGRKIEKDSNGNLIEPIIKIGKVKDGSFGNNGPKIIYTPNDKMPSSLDEIQIVIDCVKHVDAAQYCLQKYKYEVVLLDYLLAKNKVDNKPEYGYQLLEKLQEWHKHRDEKGDVYVPGPNSRFFFMFISAFATAVHERMLADGFARSERGLWYIGDGACPTNTPYLFSYQLLLLMQHRVKDLSKDTEGGFMTIIELLEKIYVDKGDAGTEETRQKAHEHFNHLLFMREKYRRLEKSFGKEDEDYLKKSEDDADYMMKMKGSLLIQSAFSVVHHFSGAFFEHLQQLVYLTAYGTIRQWQDMWEEYVFVNKELCDYDKYVAEKNDGTVVEKGKAISNAIREYIINLKENNY